MNLESDGGPVRLFEAHLQKMAFLTKASNLKRDELFVP
jgi:hypothetical protein